MSSAPLIAGWMRKAKDSSASFLGAQAVNVWMERYGRMLKLNIDSERKSIECELLLKGEAAPVTLQVRRYEIVTEAGGTFVVIHDATASREWLAAVLEDFVRGRKIPVPEKYAAVLRMIA